VFGQKSVLTLAMVRYDQPLVWSSVVAQNNSTVNLLGYDAAAPHLPFQAAALKFDNQGATNFSSNSRLEKQSSSNQRDLFQLVHKKLYADGRAGKWVNVAAGYGQVCLVESGIRKNTEELERPGCAYLKASFSF